MSRRQRIRARRRKQMMCKMLVCFIAVLAIAGFALTMKASAAKKAYDPSRDPASMSYITYHVQPGDTLFDIADRYNDDMFGTDHDYVREVERVNNMSTPDIYAGQCLLIPCGYGQGMIVGSAEH